MAKVNITQVKSRIGATKTQCKNLDALGLRRMGRTVQHEDSATIMGMIERVRHLVKLEMNAAPKADKAPKAAPAAKKAETPKVVAEVCEAPEDVKATAKKPAAPKAAKPAAPKATAEKKAPAEKKPAAKKPAAKKTEE